MLTDILYKRDSKGKIRNWQAEVEGSRWRIHTGIHEGTTTVSKWKQSVAKNVGKANETLPEAQATIDAMNAFDKKRDGEYYIDLDKVDTPKFFIPMTARTWKDCKDKVSYTDAWMQPKLDGIRCITTIDGMFSRKGKPIVSCPHIREALEPLFREFPEAVIDGELYNHMLHDKFEDIVSLVKRGKTTPESLEKTAELVQYHMYDSVSGTGYHPTFAQRLITLVHRLKHSGVDFCFSSVGSEENKSLVIVRTVSIQSEHNADQYHDTFVDSDYEGSMIRLRGTYSHSRSKLLLKRKDFDDAEFEIVRIEEGQGNWAGCAKRLIFKLADGTETAAGMKGKQAYLATVLKEKDDYVGKQATIRYFGFTKTGKPRIAVVQALHKTERL